MLLNIEALVTVYERCRSGRPLPDELQDWLANALEQYLDRRCESLNEAFGLVHGHGGIPWWREVAIRRRDASLREMADQLLPDLSINGRASTIAHLSNRYETDCWPRDREAKAMPGHYRGTSKQYLWMAFASGAKMPLSERHLRSMLGR